MTFESLGIKVSDRAVEHQSRVTGVDSEELLQQENIVLTDHLDLSDEDGHCEDMQVSEDESASKTYDSDELDSENSEIATGFGDGAEEKSNPSQTGQSSFSEPPTNFSSTATLPRSDIGGFVLSNLPVRVHEIASESHAQKRAYEASSDDEDDDANEVISVVRKRLYEVAPPGSHGSYDYVNRAPTETWESVYSEIDLDRERSQKNIDEEAVTFQKLYSQLSARLPLNAIDKMIHLLGGLDNVAELSGRTDGIQFESTPNEENPVPLCKPYKRGKTTQTNINGRIKLFINE